MPLPWDELAGLKSDSQWTITTARDQFSFQETDPWAEYWKASQTLTLARKRWAKTIQEHDTATTASTSKSRAIWQGAIAFSLVHIPVSLHSAAQPP